MPRARKCLLVGALMVVLALSASAQGRPSKSARWFVSISGTQTQHWDVTFKFSPVPTCTLRGVGDQTIRFGTPGAVRADLVPEGSAFRAYGYVKGVRRNFVPLAGTERRAYRSVEAPPDLAVCMDQKEARPYAADCSSTEALVKGTGTFVDVTGERHAHIGIRVPVQFAFQRAHFPACNLSPFEIWNFFVYPLFTYGESRPLVGGSLQDPKTRRVDAHGGVSVCLKEGYPLEGVDFTSCRKPHVSKFVTSWRVVFSR